MKNVLSMRFQGIACPESTGKTFPQMKNIKILTEDVLNWSDGQATRKEISASAA
ncbi:hypothetical protein PIB30_116142, partial [Stylosanthes scabra]|nr:hypothetical protein [Stylosanthes scabra]